jgi:hypothetical protein
LLQAAEQGDWKQVDTLFENLAQSQSLPEFFALNAIGSDHLSRHLRDLQAREFEWFDFMRLNLARVREGTTLDAARSAVSTSLADARMHAFQAIQDYIYGDEPEP